MNPEPSISECTSQLVLGDLYQDPGTRCHSAVSDVKLRLQAMEDPWHPDEEMVIPCTPVVKDFNISNFAVGLDAGVGH